MPRVRDLEAGTSASGPTVSEVSRPERPASGVLVVDKVRGPTSHDVVARARRAFGTRAVGHAGTLDPLATGVLVLAVGEGTKLVAYLTADDKEYEVEITLGMETDTLDAQGTAVRSASLPEGLCAPDAQRAAAAFLGTTWQRAPLVSAIKVGGRRLHQRFRRGEEIEAPQREVALREVEVIWARPDAIAMRLVCGKGFYVRSFGRDLAEALGTVGHVRALRRLRSGPYRLDRAVTAETLEAAARGEAGARETLRGRMVCLTDAWRGPTAVLSEAGVRDARHGRPVLVDALVSGRMPEVASAETVALVGPGGALVALARLREGSLRVVRGFRP